jgi:tRNA dimethylallyltransferase
MMSRLIFIIGPTAIGKSALAVKLAKRLGAEIISCDSMQVYKGMRILSQAPTSAEKRSIRHHLVGALSPSKEYSVSLFIDKAARIIRSILKKKKFSIIVGGSGLYVKALIDGLFPSPPADMNFRKKMERYAFSYGVKKLYKKLVKLDREAADTIHPNDLRRIVRALEIHHTTGKTMTQMKAETKGLKDIYDISIFALTAPREEIYRRIERRVDKMFDGGIVGEVKRLKNKKLSKTAGSAIGLREVRAYLTGECDIEAAKDTLKKNTRRFAKRQLTWLRANKRIKWFDVTRIKEADIINSIIKRLTHKRK